MPHLSPARGLFLTALIALFLQGAFHARAQEEGPTANEIYRSFRSNVQKAIRTFTQVRDVEARKLYVEAAERIFTADLGRAASEPDITAQSAFSDYLREATWSKRTFIQGFEFERAKILEAARRAAVQRMQGLWIDTEGETPATPQEVFDLLIGWFQHLRRTFKTDSAYRKLTQSTAIQIFSAAVSKTQADVLSGESCLSNYQTNLQQIDRVFAIRDAELEAALGSPNKALKDAAQNTLARCTQLYSQRQR